MYVDVRTRTVTSIVTEELMIETQINKVLTLHKLTTQINVTVSQETTQKPKI
jgi:hypothetical protein